MPGSRMLDVRLGERRFEQSDLLTPEVLGGFVIVPFMEMQGQYELRFGVKIRASPRNKGSQHCGIGVGERATVPRFRSFAPIQGDAGDEERVIQTLCCERPGVSSNPLEFGPSPVLGVDRHTLPSASTRSVFDCCYLVRR